ncbi:MAG: DUF5343 domain-containing protein [Nitrospirae bacterium]|nr:DUF5343 domain-containing protein [Nitrospirota bacterium]
MAKYPPYVNGYGQLPKLFAEIKKAAVPPKFTQDFMSSMLGLKSSSYRAMIPLLKNLGFLDQGNVPTQDYKDFRDDTKSILVLAKRIKETYADLFTANEYAYKLSKEELTSKFITMLGLPKDDKNIPFVVATLQELFKLADFTGKHKTDIKKKQPDEGMIEKPLQETSEKLRQLGISYTINLNLPATTEVEVFNAIFKSLKEHILSE